MDLVGHFELPTAQLNPATASAEEREYAINLGRRCVSYYMSIVKTMDALRLAKIDVACR